MRTTELSPFAVAPWSVPEGPQAAGDRAVEGCQAAAEDAIDTSSPSRKLVFHVVAALAEFERGVIRERTTAGLRAARERGTRWGRPPALSAKDLQAAKAMLKDSDITVAGIFSDLGRRRQASQ